MANYETLKAAIQAVIYENGNQEITGSVMQAILLAMVNSLGANYQYAGIATPSTNPGTPDQNVFYLASTAGTYVNFGNIVLAENEVAILKYNGSWTKETSGLASDEKVNQLDQELNGGTVQVSVSPEESTAGIRIANTGSTTNSGTTAPNCTTASYKIGAGNSAALHIPKLDTNQYTMAYGFASAKNTTAGHAVTLPSPAVPGPVTDADYNITLPSGHDYLIVCYTTSYGVPTVTVEKEEAGIVGDVAEMKGKINNIFGGSVILHLPNKFRAVVGDVLQIFHRGILQAVNPANYNILFTCAKGANYPRYWQVYITNAADVGTYPVTVTVTDNLGNTIAEGTTSLEVVAAPSSPASAKKIVPIGASTTAPGKWPAECFRRLTGTGGTPAGKGLSNIAFCGPMEKDGAGYFGVGGWTWLNYISAGGAAFRFQVSGVSALSLGAVYTNNNHSYTVIEVNVTNGVGNILCTTSSASNTPSASGTLTKSSGDGDASVAFSSAAADAANPFWDYRTNTLDFQTFADTYCGGTIDCIIPLLGWNGRIKYETSFGTLKAQVKTFVDAFHTAFPSAKVLLLGINCPSPIGGMGANYGSSQDYSDWYGMTVSALNIKDAYQDLANESDYSSFVEFVDIAAQFDCEYNLPKQEVGVNTRNDDQKEWHGTNGIHPADSGYGQIADAVYRAIVEQFC